MEKIAVYPGSFDPITNGHMDIITRASKMYDKLVVAVLVNKQKKSLFTVEERVELIKKSTVDIPNVEVDSFSGLFVDYCTQKEIHIAIRGLRALSDFDLELQMAHMNDFLSKGKVDTVFLVTSTKHSYISSSTVKEIAMFRGRCCDLVPKPVCDELTKKFLRN
ncbi:MAG: pantetheine-phosphate adenylyltransferase [Peptoanaerobacter stomatis]|uniref:pantetheine-phosphate adenylyltransferase n=1 Tax=Peptoanaerobacter stomatis TaxID=796937 RepID=UPI003F9F44BE